MVHQWKEVMQLFGLGLLQQVLKNNRHKGQDLLLQTDHHPVEVLPDPRLYQLPVGGDIYGLQEDLQQVGEGLHTATGLHGLLTRKSFAHSAENTVATYEKNCLDVNLFMYILTNVLRTSIFWYKAGCELNLRLLLIYCTSITSSLQNAKIINKIFYCNVTDTLLTLHWSCTLLMMWPCWCSVHKHTVSFRLSPPVACSTSSQTYWQLAKVTPSLSDVFSGEKNNELYYNFSYYLHDKTNCILHRTNACTADLPTKLH